LITFLELGTHPPSLLANFFSEAISRFRIVIELLFDAAQHRVEEDGWLSFRLPTSENPENAGETS
jgi:hypothetical protein